MYGHCGRHGYEHEGHDRGCGCGGHHDYRAITLEEEIKGLEQAKIHLEERLTFVNTMLEKLKK